MGSAQVYGFLTASFLILTLLADSTAACYCQGQAKDLQKEYCKSDVVVKGKFLNATIGDPLWYWVRYDFETTKVFKIPPPMIEVQSLYTQLLGTTCTYRHDGPFTDDEYIVTGSLMGNDVRIDVCHFIKPWDQLFREETRALLMMLYPRRCESMS